MKWNQVTGRVLVVEDEPIVLRFCRVVLERAGFEVLAAANGETALQMASPASSVALALVDLVLEEGESGEWVIRRLREGGMRGPVVCMSGYPASQVPGIADPLALSPYFLAKPFTQEQLLSKLDMALRGVRRGGGSGYVRPASAS